MTDEHAHSRREARLRLQAQAAAIGVTPDLIDALVDEFYARIRADETLGPIFNAAIGDGWPAHLVKLKTFWASVALNAGAYAGKPMQVHAALPDIRPDHFARWLELFDSTLADLAPTDAARDWFMVRARRIAESLKLGLFYKPS